MKPICSAIAISLALSVVAVSLIAQRVPAKKPSFEVASIKPSTVLQALPEVLQQTSFSVSDKLRGGRFTARGVTVRGLIRAAYSPAGAPPLVEGQLVGGPAWIETDFFDIEAKAESSQTRPEEAQLMLQSLLEDRFQLKYHREPRELRVLSLAVAKGGHKLKLSDDQTPAPAVIDRPRPPTPSFGQRGDVLLSLPRPRGLLGITAKLSGQSVVSTASGSGVPISELVRHLENSLHRPVIDKTNLKGLFDITLAIEGPRNVPVGGPAGGASDPSSPSKQVSQEVTPLFASALEKQLGLKLEQVKGPLEVIVIDSISKTNLP
jgi:uncharacterized protein (TIGR03435 family)